MSNDPSKSPIISASIAATPKFKYGNPSDVPGHCASMIGRRVKVKDSIKDKKKKNMKGVVVDWKNSNTVSMKCDNGITFNVRITSIEFLDSVVTINNVSDKKIKIPESPETSKSNLKETGEDNSTQCQRCEKRSVRKPTKLHIQVNPDVFRECISHLSPPNNRTRLDFDNDNDPAIGTEKNSSELKTSEYQYPTQVPAHCSSIIGRRVQVKDSIKDKKKRNMKGFVVDWKNSITVSMKCDSGSTINVRLKSIDFINVDDIRIMEEAAKTKEERLSPLARVAKKISQISRQSPTSVLSSKAFNLSKNKGSGEGQISPIAAAVQKVRKISRQARSLATPKPSVDSNNERENWKVPQSHEGTTKFGNYLVDKIRVKTNKNAVSSETTFFDHLLDNRIVVLDAPLHGGRDQKSFDKNFTDDSGQSFELVSCKQYDDVQVFGFMQNKVARLMYAKTNGSTLEAFSIENHLLRIADFTTLNPRKVAARLELFQSPTRLNIMFLNESEFNEIPDQGYVGGGFINDSKLVEVLERAGMTGTHAKRAVAIQVRIFIPSIGVFKGMLMRKRHTVGAPIELPWGMKKVLKSLHPEPFPGAALVICKNGVFPSPGSANEYIGRKLDPNLKAPPEKSFQAKIKKPLTKMIFRVWQTMGVSEELCQKYAKESIKPEFRNHAWLVGVPDPTDRLPPDTIFVPGMKTIQPTELFVTRSPCYAYEHGRKLSTVTKRPESMSDEDWDWLNNQLNFGVIIFSNPRSGMKSIPERIANGDLDGDLYLVCWDENILNSMKACPLSDEISDDDNGKLSVGDSNPNWLKDAQDIMIDASVNNGIGRLTGILYRMAEKIADNSDLTLNDPDANACYEAYNSCLEFAKHGRDIILPGHLIEKIPVNLRSLLKSSNENPD